MRSPRSKAASVIAAALVAATASADAPPLVPAPDAAPIPLTLRLRDVPFTTVLRTLFHLTGQGYVSGGDLAAHVDVEIIDVMPDAIERALEAAGLTFSEPGPLRRASLAGDTPAPSRTGLGFPLNLEYVNLDVREFLRLVEDISAWKVVAPPGPLGQATLFCRDLPLEDVIDATLSTAGLASRREPGRLLVFRRTDPKAVLLPLDATGPHSGHVGYREGEAGPGARSSGIAGILVSEVKLLGLARAGESSVALLDYPRHLAIVADGQRLYDGVVESVTMERVVLVKNDGTRSELVLSPAAPGIVRRADRAETTVALATARVGSGEFEEADRILRTALAATVEASETTTLRAGLADVHYRWGQVLSERYRTEDAIRHFEEAYAIDGTDRLWQAGEDLNEIGFAWTALGEPARAEGFHRRALEVSRTAEARKEPPRGECVRYHPRANWSKAAALNGLANAERLRGRFAEAAKLYGQALDAWKETSGGDGATASLTGLGLVHHGQGRYAEALELHRRALKNRVPNPSDRAAILDNIGSAQLALRQTDEARATFGEALGIYRGLRDRAGEGIVLNNLGAVAEALSDRAQACASYADALVASRDADDRRGAAITLRHLQRLVEGGKSGDRALDPCRAALSAP
jgi:tetratricopeptide (TPR) repeat protein